MKVPLFALLTLASASLLFQTQNDDENSKLFQFSKKMRPGSKVEGEGEGGEGEGVTPSHDSTSNNIHSSSLFTSTSVTGSQVEWKTWQMSNYPKYRLRTKETAALCDPDVKQVSLLFIVCLAYHAMIYLKLFLYI